VRLGVVVEAVKPDQNAVVLAGGESIRYDRLLCASGGPARSFRVPEGFVIPGAELDGIFPLREAAHSTGIAETVKRLGPQLRVRFLGSMLIYYQRRRLCAGGGSGLVVHRHGGGVVPVQNAELHRRHSTGYGGGAV
jgi:NADPH-dependent 2,4-dienoyl-CoA reductase/sulfur reductase-like enzyme